MENQRIVGKAEHKLLTKCELEGYLSHLDEIENLKTFNIQPISELLAYQMAIIRLRSEINKSLKWNQIQP